MSNKENNAKGLPQIPHAPPPIEMIVQVQIINKEGHVVHVVRFANDDRVQRNACCIRMNEALRDGYEVRTRRVAALIPAKKENKK